MRASNEFAQLFIRGLQWDAQDRATTFVAVLKTAARARLTQTTTGKVLVGTSAAGVSAQFSLPPTADLTAEDLGELCAVLLAKVDELTAATPGITDTAIVTGLLAAYPITQPRRKRVTVMDFSGATI